MASVNRLADAVEPRRGQAGQTFHARLVITEAAGFLGELEGQEIELAVQPPDRLFVAGTVSGEAFELGRIGQELWLHAVDKQFCLIGRPDVPAFRSLSEAGVAKGASGGQASVSVNSAKLEPIDLPVSRFRLNHLPRHVDVIRQADEWRGTNLCYVLTVEGTRAAVKKKRVPAGRLQLWVRQSDMLPVRIEYSGPSDRRIGLEAREIGFDPAWVPERWEFSPAEEDRYEVVALSHLTEFLSSRWSTATEKIPPLGPATGERRLLATEGRGRLELIDGTKVLFLEGSPEEMGRQHGTLLKKEIRKTVRNVLYGVGIGSSLANGTWFLGEMEAAQKRLLPHMNERHLREMDALAGAAGVTREEMRMANLFPELFHCSGFALYGEATADGRMYHGRILDYFRGLGLEQSAVVIVAQPDYGHAWVNISYAGFVGSVTAMNEHHVAIGEIGGRGEGQWDGKPMAQLVREVMESAATIDEAVEIMRRGPRTCEYFYVISDAKSRRAVAIRATPREFETACAGETHPLIPEAIKDVVTVSGGDRLTELIARIKSGYGEFDAESARELMTRPVCMKSNIHSVLFAPDTLDFWVANADSENVASHARYTHYNLRELLDSSPDEVATASR